MVPINEDLDRVLAVLRGEDGVANFDPQHLWSALDRAEREQVSPLFVSKLRAANLSLSTELEARCSSAAREFASSTFWWKSELKGILKAFASADVPVILLKGPSFAERVYGGSALRLSRDLDLLVSRQALEPARTILAEIGFVPREYATFHEQWLRGTTMVELHFGLADAMDFEVNSEVMCARAQAILFAGQPALRLSAADELLFLCLHGVRHGYERLSYVIDVALAWKALAPSASWDDLYDNRKLIPLLLLGHAMASRMAAIDLPDSLAVSEKSARKITRISEALWSAFSHPHDRFSLWRYPRRLSLALQPNIRAQMMSLWAASSAVYEDDRAFAARFHIKSRPMIWAVRQLRLLSKVVRRKTSA